MHVGASLRLLRTEAGLSLKTLGQAIGVSAAYLSRVENGHDPAPTADRLCAIARVFGLPSELLLDLTGRAAVPGAPSLASRTLLQEVARRRLGPAQIGRVLDFIAREFPEGPAAPGIAGLLTPDRVMLGVRVGRLEDAVDLAAMRLVPDGGSEALAQALHAREYVFPSAVGAGLLLPHAAGFAPSPTACLVLLDPPCDAATPDDAPIRAVLAVIGLGEGAPALSWLARAARLADPELIAQFTAARSVSEVMGSLAGAG
jgi:PTS system nitrogen regulatory IIA component